MAKTSAPVNSTAIVEIERLGFGWALVPDYDLARLEGKQREVQVRESKHYSPRETVEQYAIMMGETAFPPPVLTADDRIVDGNTRVAARLKRKEKITPAIVLEVSWEDATEKQKAELIALAATLNQTGGQRLTSKESREVAASLIELNWKTEEIGRAIGVKSATVAQVKREIAAVKKLDKVGMGTNGALRGASLRALGVEKVVNLNDAPFRELALLAADAGFNSGEITSTAKEIRETGSDEGGLERIKALRVELGNRIREHKLTGAAKPPVSRQLRQHLGYVTKFDGQAQDLVETDKNVQAMHVESLTRSIAVLTEVLRLQEQG